MAQKPNVAEPSKHRAYPGRRRRLGLGLGNMFNSQRRQCRTGRHRYAQPTPVGGGILRHACSACGAVSLDLREATEPAVTQLFRRQGELRTFAILRRQIFNHR